MTDLRKAAEMALDALEIATTYLPVKTATLDEVEKAIKALRQALAQPEQEPVGYVTIENISSWAQVPSIKWFKKPTEGPLYTAPPKKEWVGLTDEEKGWCVAPSLKETMDRFEAKLKEKNA